MVLCGITLFGFCTSVVCDIVTRTIGAPWLWLQEVTSWSHSHGAPMVRVTMSQTTERLKAARAKPHSIISTASSLSSARHFSRRWRCSTSERSPCPSATSVTGSR